MSTAEQALISFFEQVAQKNSDQLEKLKNEQSFSVTNERWCFTLPDLYLFLCDQNKVFCRTDYKQFIQLIFSCLINQTIKLYGAEITIIKNLGKVDKSSYALVWKNALE
ncbi:MAG: hypothetical protein COA54_06530 [Thiotrichaceae bacterium]|nr:MAG: hypothetical protein COA54_06530 [Thiotrichaceae bacterium]